MSNAKKIGPSYVAAVALLGAACAIGAGCSGSREDGDDGRAASALVVSPDLVISQVYGGGGNSGAQYTHDFVEIFNRGSSTVSLSGKSLQYTSFSAAFSNVNNVVALPAADVPAGKYFLVKLGSGGANGVALPTVDHEGGPTNLSATNGKVALVDTLLNACGQVGTPCTPGGWIDLVGYGTASQSEGSAATAASNTSALIRKTAGCNDTGNNSVDFEVGVPTPRNAATTVNTCTGTPPPDAGGTDAPPSDGSVTPGQVLLNEVKVNPPGNTDSPWEYAEILCAPGASLTGYYFVAIEGDGDSSTGTPGTADVVVSLASQSCGTNGIAYIKAATGGAPPLANQSSVITAASLDTGSSPFENATTSFVIIHSPTTALTATTDYDTDNDGVLDLPAGASVVDGVSTYDQGDGSVDQTYGPRLIMAGSPPDGLVRVPGNTTAMSAAGWYFGELAGTAGDGVAFDTAKPLSANFPTDGEMTPGAPNVGTGAVIITDGGTTVDGSVSSDSGKTDSGKTDAGGTIEEEDGGLTGGNTTKKDAGKASGTNNGTGGGSVPPSAGGCSAAPIGVGQDAGFLASALVALGALLTGGRRRRK